MSIEINGKIIETDEEGYLLSPDEWGGDVAKVLVSQREAAGHKKVTESGWALIWYFRDYYDEHMNLETSKYASFA